MRDQIRNLQVVASLSKGLPSWVKGSSPYYCRRHQSFTSPLLKRRCMLLVIDSSSSEDEGFHQSRSPAVCTILGWRPSCLLGLTISATDDMSTASNGGSAASASYTIISSSGRVLVHTTTSSTEVSAEDRMQPNGDSGDSATIEQKEI